MLEDLNLHTEFMLYHSAMPAIGALVSYRIAEHLETGPKSVEELASLASISSSRLFRYLRLSSYFQVFAFDSDSHKWANTKRSLILTSSLSRSLWELVSHPKLIENYVHATSLLASDREPFEIKNTPNPFEVFAQNPDLLSKFQKNMTELTKNTLKNVIDNIDIGDSKKVLDVGGADGSLVLGIVKKHDLIKGGIMERPEVEPIANLNISENGLSERVQFHEGNFFESITEGYDCIVMKHIIHDWNDEKASLILKNCRKVLKEGDKVFIVDMVVDINSEFYPNNLAMDFLMLVVLGAKERTIEEFGKLFSENGFRLNSVKRFSDEAIIEAVAV